jgi:hypothetical protein
MDTLSTTGCNPSFFDLKDAIHGKLQKSKAILTAIMFATEFIHEDMALDNHTVYHALWAVDDYLENIESLLEQL